MNNPTCPKCRHADHDGYPCLNMASDNDCPCTSPSGMYPALSSPPTEEVRAWRPEDGDTRCQSCGRPNPIWWADNKQWNATVGGPEATDDPGGVLCPTCYHTLWLGGQITAPHPPTPTDDVREALDVEALMGRLWAAADNAGVSREAVEFEWPECHKPKCQGTHGRPDVAMFYMKRAIMAEIESELRDRLTTRPDHAPETDSPERAAALNLAILLRNHNVRDEGTFIRAAERIVEAYPELVSVLSGREVCPRGPVTDAEVDRAAYIFWDAMLRIQPREAMRAALEAAREARS